jgi:T4-like virus tail tube protein gp19
MRTLALDKPLAALVAAFLCLSSGAAAAADRRDFTAGRFALDIGGVQAGWVMSAEGGGATADVVEEKPGPDGFAKKHLAGVKYEDISLQIGFAMAKPVYDWIAASWTRSFTRKDGSIVAADFRRDARSERQFFHALVTETTIPACDGASKEPGFIGLKIAPELTKLVKAGGRLPIDLDPPQSRWLPANFRLSIDGLDTSRVSKIESFTVKQKIVENPVGENRDFEKEPGTIEFPNLKIELSDSSAQSWIDWHDDFVIRGNNGEDKERNGTLELLSPDLRTVLVRVRFFNMGIVSVGPAKAVPNPCQAGCPIDAGDDAARRVLGKTQAELYVERMEFQYLGPGRPGN